MNDAKFILQVLWLALSGAAFIVSLLLRRSSLILATNFKGGRYFRSQGQAWTGVAVEIASAFARGATGFFLPPTLLVVILLAIGVAGRVFQIARLLAANNAISNGR